MKVCFAHFILTKEELARCIPLPPEVVKPNGCSFCNEEAKVNMR